MEKVQGNAAESVEMRQNVIAMCSSAGTLQDNVTDYCSNTVAIHYTADTAAKMWNTGAFGGLVPILN